MQKHFTFLFLFLLSKSLFAQAPMRQMNSSEILLQLKKLNILGSALYIAAHPDDENTAMLTWLSKERLARTGYLSCTRGDGGQNLIGTEQGELLGLIRTHELLEARKIDGPEQYFTRANDFGFSKTTEETMRFWGKDQVLADVVWRIRLFRPDVIICRFPPDQRAGHGNHSASAALAEDAYKAAADPTMFPEQLKYVQPWQATRLVWNTFNFGATSQKPTDPGSFIMVNVGEFNPLLGKSFTEIAGQSRSMHKSQGMGAAQNKGIRPEYLLHKAGTTAKKDIFDDIDITWNRVKGGASIQAIIQQAIEQYKVEKPSAIIPLLIQAHQKINTLSNEPWAIQKKQEIESLIVQCAGLWAEANAKDYVTSMGDKVSVQIQTVKRSDAKVILSKASIAYVNQQLNLNDTLQASEIITKTIDFDVPKQTPISQPYWLAEPHSLGSYRVNDQQLIGLPLKPSELEVSLTYNFDGYPISVLIPITHKTIDAVKGEIYRPLEVRPEVTANISNKVYVFSDNKAKPVEVLLKSAIANAKGEISLEVPQGWKISPQSIAFDLANKNQEQKVIFMLTPSTQSAEGVLKALCKTSNGTYSKGLYTMNYDHIPALVYFPEAEAKVIRLDVKIKGKHIGYIAGAGDEVPAALQQMGYMVTMLNEEELNKDLSLFDAIVVGVRAYNTEERLKFAQKRLMAYVQNGGNMVVQYQTNFRLVTEDLGPYPFKLSRDRVSVEDAPIKLLNPAHTLLNTPNQITDKDFEGWVQERGLYFASQWDNTQYEALFACNDPNEKELTGSTLYAKYGKGHYTFTGLSFFRQLPAGVVGAYRLFANMISVGK